jgi:hypothetical protein
MTDQKQLLKQEMLERVYMMSQIFDTCITGHALLKEFTEVKAISEQIGALYQTVGLWRGISNND